MSRALVVINSVADRQKICRWANQAPWATRVEWKSPKRSLDQNAKMWVLLTEVAEQLPWHGKKMPADSWKLMFLDALKRSKHEPLDIVPNTDGTGFVNLSTSSSDLGKDEMAELIELIMAFGTEHGVIFQDPTVPSESPPSDEGRDVDDPPKGVAVENSEGESTSAIMPDAPSDGGSADPADRSTAANLSSSEEKAGEVVHVGLSDASPAEHECIKKLLAIVADPALNPKEKAQNLGEAADIWLGALGPDRKEFVTSVFTTSKKVLRGELQADPARKYLEGLAA